MIDYHSVVSYVVKLREPATNWSGAVSRLSGRKDNPYTVILELVMRKEEFN